MNYLNAINNTLQYIESDLKKSIDKEYISHNFGVSYEIISRIFSVLTGMTLNKYIRMRRLSEAAREVACTNKKILEIAQNYGYESTESFDFAFKQYHEASPSEVRMGAHYNSLLPMSVRVDIEGGHDIKVNIEVVPSLRLSVLKIGELEEVIVDDKKVKKIWDDFIELLNQEIDAEKIDIYELIYDNKDGIVMYYAGCQELETSINDKLGLEIIEIPQTKYVVFTVKRGEGDSPLDSTLKYIMQTFFQDESRPPYRSPEFGCYKPGNRKDKDYIFQIYVVMDE